MLTVHDIIENKKPFHQVGKPLECLMHELNLHDQEGDIHIVTFPKTGTVISFYITFEYNFVLTLCSFYIILYTIYYNFISFLLFILFLQTILQYIVHLIRTDGLGVEFDDIHQVCPHTSSAWYHHLISSYRIISYHHLISYHIVSLSHIISYHHLVSSHIIIS